MHKKTSLRYGKKQQFYVAGWMATRNEKIKSLY